MSYLLRGILIGLLFGLPVGAVGTMTVHRTLNSGIKAGLFTGVGSSIADCFYACVGVFGLTLVSDFLLQYQVIINILGGGFVMYMGICLLIKKEHSSDVKAETINPVKMFLSSFVVGITNPAAILTFLFAFSYFGISAGAKLPQGMMLVCGVFVGTYIWWGTLSAVTCLVKRKTEKFNFRYMNRIFGTILCLFGAIILLRLIFA